ncbi:MAG: CRISPR-associated helicase Cas3' [Deltaproteobacteria bacterium]|nr:CRISPR-associated helicase Cas3' [Deltaproteobacteria bacterium]
MNEIAHSENDNGKAQLLSEHLENVARITSKFSSKFDAEKLGYIAGLLHDIGKYNPDFQSYLKGSRKKSVDHKGPGALFAMNILELLALPISGHHGGLPSRQELKTKVKQWKSESYAEQAIKIAQKELPRLPKEVSFPEWFREERHTVEFFIRMLFSALVDADFLDTESHFQPERGNRRETRVSLHQIWEQLEIYEEKLSSRPSTPINEVRRHVYKSCLEAAECPQGFFKLMVPTGGGKTLSGLAFALKHAIHHDLERVIFAIPYTSIIEQTVREYRNIFGHDAVLEHHSAVEWGEDEEYDERVIKHQLATENWDFPLVVTTNVQLFESLFSNKPSHCRKLHSIANSVIVLDEVQTIPPGLIEPVISVLKELVNHYGVSVVLCTATQPALENNRTFEGIPEAKEIVSDTGWLYDTLKRVNYRILDEGKPVSWERVAEIVNEQEQCLAIVNTRKDAMKLLNVLDDPEVLHLSTQLCGAHRREVLMDIRKRLENNQPCKVVSTQIVEAGVDIDFPVLLRAFGPLDSIVQAAGRCNREGKLEQGEVYIFYPEEGSQPQGSYRTATDTAKSMLKAPDELHNPQIYEKYFQGLYQGVKTDAYNIRELQRNFDYTEVSRRFKFINQPTETVIVPYDNNVDELMHQLRSAKSSLRHLLRKLQPYMVNIPRYEFEKYKSQGLVKEVMEGLWEWCGKYDEKRGVAGAGHDPAQFIVS